ncbi:4-phosphopantetheinyl transferase [Agrococcus sp. 1P02AA]|uniref:4-phosphopantetheinyl transferase n=1 Tax=Agrococcus sp. 1P02AA TaxID=3132259 RepID=UPI0039A49885
MRVADAMVAHVRGDRSAADDALRALVASLAGVDDASEIVIVQRCPDCGGAHGRPVVAAPAAARGIGVSRSHAGAAGSAHHVVAAAPGVRVGIDAEPRDAPAARLDAVRALLASPAEPLRRWTQIEAVLKADGRGLRVDPAAVVLEETAAGLTASAPGSARRYAVHDVALRDEHDADDEPDLVVSLAIEVRRR